MRGIVSGLSLLVILIWSSNLGAQRGLEVGPWIGGAWYVGDLNNGLDMTRPGGAGGLQVRYLFDPRIAVSANLSYSVVYGDDRWSDNLWERDRGLNFRSSIIDFSPNLEINFMPYEHGKKEHAFTPYLGVGFSIFSFTPTSKYVQDGRLYEFDDLSSLVTDVTDSTSGTYSTFSYGANITFGFKYNIKYKWSAQIFASIRWLTTDYLDGVSEKYPDLSGLDETADRSAIIASDPGYFEANRVVDEINYYGRRPFSQRGNSSSWDSYNFIGIGITYFFGGLQCPDIVKTKKK